MNYLTILNYAIDFVKSKIEELCGEVHLNGLEYDDAHRLSLLLKDLDSLNEELDNRIKQSKQDVE